MRKHRVWGGELSFIENPTNRRGKEKVSAIMLFPGAGEVCIRARNPKESAKDNHLFKGKRPVGEVPHYEKRLRNSYLSATDVLPSAQFLEKSVNVYGLRPTGNLTERVDHFITWRRKGKRTSTCARKCHLVVESVHC